MNLPKFDEFDIIEQQLINLVRAGYATKEEKASGTELTNEIAAWVAWERGVTGTSSEFQTAIDKGKASGTGSGKEIAAGAAFLIGKKYRVLMDGGKNDITKLLSKRAKQAGQMGVRQLLRLHLVYWGKY